MRHVRLSAFDFFRDPLGTSAEFCPASQWAPKMELIDWKQASVHLTALSLPAISRIIHGTPSTLSIAGLRRRSTRTWLSGIMPVGLPARHAH